MRIRSKLFLSYILLVAVSVGILTIISLSETSRKLEEDTKETLDHHLSSAWKQYYVRSEQMRLGMLQAASTGEIIEGIAAGDRAFLKERLLLWKEYRPYVDIWLFADSSGMVMARLGQGFGDRPSFIGVVEAAIKAREPVVSTEMLTREELQREGIQNPEHLVNGRGMAVLVAVPVLNGSEPLGAIVTGDLLNGDTFVARELRDVVTDARVAIVQDGVVVSALPRGPLGMGAAFPEDILSSFASGALNMWVKLDGEEWILTGETIRSSKGEALGSMVVAAPKAVFFAHVNELQRSLVVTALLALIFAIVLALISTEELAEPILRLAEAARRIRKGELGVTVKTDRLSTRDELGELTQAFNTMSKELNESYRSLKEALEYNQSIITNAPIGIFTTDKGGRIISANPRHMEMMGWKDEKQGIGLDLFELPPVKERGWDKLLKKALKGEPVELYHKDYTSIFGREMCINLKAVPIKKNGDIQGLLVLVEDITERKRAEERIKELSMFPERNPNPVLKVSVSGEVLYHNPGVFNYVETAQEIPDLLPQNYVSLVKTACATGRDVRVDHRYKDRVFDYVIYPISASAAHLYGRDITERKTYEEELKRRINELERMHRIMVGRELRMKELKERIKRLEEELGRVGNG